MKKPDGWVPNGKAGQCQAWAKTKGAQCTNAPRLGQRVCKKHGANTPQALAAAQRRLTLVEIRAELDKGSVLYGAEVDIDPLDALVGQVCEAAGNVEILRRLVQELEQRYVGRVEGEIADAAGIAGPDHLGDGAPHVLVNMYDRERERLARMAKLCVDAGVAQRQIDLAERQGELIAQVIKGVLDDLGVGDDERVPSVVRRQLELVAGGGT